MRMWMCLFFSQLSTLFLQAQGTESSVRRLPEIPKTALMIHLGKLFYCLQSFDVHSNVSPSLTHPVTINLPESLDKRHEWGTTGRMTSVFIYFKLINNLLQILYSMLSYELCLFALNVLDSKNIKSFVKPHF